MGKRTDIAAQESNILIVKEHNNFSVPSKVFVREVLSIP
jgi:hypothetical protein